MYEHITDFSCTECNKNGIYIQQEKSEMNTDGIYCCREKNIPCKNSKQKSRFCQPG